MELSRNQIQTKIFECSYIYLVYRNMNISFDVEKIISEVCEDIYDNCDLFLRETILKMIINYDSIKEIIENNLVNWKFDRLSLIDRAILFMTISEYKYVGDIDKPVVINVGVTLAKRYSDEKNYKFINGILDKIL
ncbi:MAG: transcription antitermination factor NusB [Firmicutes bacterium]|nr:transcription antitermination factor NusB [Candidatus Alectryobacillus merdavium]